MLGGGIGFVLAACGWWFILWHWVPIYANILNVEVFVPLGMIVGADGWVSFFSTAKGLFWASVITAFLASAFIALGVGSTPASRRSASTGLVGLGFMMILLLVNSKADFISALNTQSSEVLGTSGDVYAEHTRAGRGNGFERGRLRHVQGHVPPHPVPPLLQPLVELGRDALRRGQWRFRLP